MTQKELGLAIGFEEKGADNRIAQYETNYRVPKRELLDKIAQALRVDRQNFYTVQPGCAEDFMRTFFWLDEDSPGSIRLFQLVRNPGKIGASDDTAVRYNDTDDWPAQPPVGIYFNYGLVDDFMREWLLRQQELHAGEITREEYFEWKINWPSTCDDGKESKYYVPWRKEK
nr:helix-turn-helix transcriptional regulator [uncultured Oscillibacter sp.]